MTLNTIRRLSLRIWYRQTGQPCRFWFSADGGPGLVLEGLSPTGFQKYADIRRRLKGALPPTARVHAGIALVDADGRYVFVGAGLGPELLTQLADWCRLHVARCPALANLADSGVVDAAVDLKDDAALRGLDPVNLPVHHDPTLWDGLLEPTAAAMADVLARAEPGARLWFWLDGDARGDELPLLVQPIADDPNSDRMNQLIEALVGGFGRAVTGVAQVVDDGHVQFVTAASSLRPQQAQELLLRLAAWAVLEAPHHPGLGRLADAELVLTEAGRVREVVAQADLWEDLPKVVAPGTLAHSAAQLQALEAGDEAWFWASLGPEPFVRVLPMTEREALPVVVKALQRRFAKQPHRLGVVRRLGSGRLLFTAMEGHARWADACAALAEVPGLDALRSSVLVSFSDGRLHTAPLT